MCLIQSQCKEVAQGDIFMEQKMRFGLVLGQLAILKKTIEADYDFEGSFFMFSWTKKVQNFTLPSALKSCMKTSKKIL